jgi:hypothetical protein
VCGHENIYLPYEESKLRKKVHNMKQIFIFSYYSLVETLLLPLSPSFGHAAPDNRRPHHHWHIPSLSTVSSLSQLLETVSLQDGEYL